MMLYIFVAPWVLLMGGLACAVLNLSAAQPLFVTGLFLFFPSLLVFLFRAVGWQTGAKSPV